MSMIRIVLFHKARQWTKNFHEAAVISLREHKIRHENRLLLKDQEAKNLISS